MRTDSKLITALLSGALFAPAVPAEVTYSGPVNITLNRDFTGTGLDLVTGAVSNNPNDEDAEFMVFEFSDEWRFANLDTIEGGGIVVQEPGSLVAELLEPGDLVGAGSPLRQGGGIRTLGLFDDVSPAYAGLLFENEATGTLHYGWVELTLPSVGGGAITAYAYNSISGQGLVVPEPSSLLLLGLPALLLRRRA